MLLRVLSVRLARYRRAIACAVALQAVQAAAALYLPTLNADVIDNGVVRGDTSYILRLGGVMLAVTLVQICCAAGSVYFAARTAMGIGRDLRADVFRRVQTFSAREVGRFGAPSLITRSTNDVQQVQSLALMVFTMMVPAPIVCLGGVVMALRQDVPLSSLVLVVVPVLVVAIAVLVRSLRPRFKSMQQRIDRINQVLREQIMGVRVIRAFVRDETERARFSTANTDLTQVGISTGRLMALMTPTIMITINLSCVAVLWFGGHRVVHGLQIGALMAFLSYLLQILIAVMMATFVVVMLPRADVCAERILEVLDTESTLVMAATPVLAMPVPGTVELRAVSFRYPGAQKPVLEGISLVAERGRTTAVVGSTGSGKTTLLNLIPRLVDATDGAVLVGGVDVRELAPEVLCRSVGLVPQQSYLFAGTVASNLRFANPGATDEELWHSLEVAQARAFVAAMPGGLDAPIGQGGTNLSGGQRQRLAIARMIVAKPDICLLDDAFSALDVATDAALRAALASELCDASVVIVAQRVSTIRDADRIVVLDEGRVVGIGTHAELLARNPTYREIVLSQLTEAEAIA